MEKGKALCLFMLMLLAAPVYVSAQETLTIYPDATGTSSYVPIPGGSVAQFMKSEFVIPASQLEAVEGGTISQMTFHLSQTGSINGSLNFQVFLKEVNATSINSYYGPEGATIVYEGPLDGSQSTMDIDFANNYTYHGGNLLVGVYQLTNTYFVTTIQFWGQTVSGASVQGTGRSLEGVSCTQRNFIPKTTFTYTAGNNTCPVPKNLAISNLTNNSATLSWTQTGGVDHWDVFYTDNPNYEPRANTHPQFANITDNPITITGLPSGRTYYVYARANCGDEVGDWSSPCVFLLAEQITLNDGTYTNYYVPVAGDYVSYSNTYGKFILPATDLQSLIHAEISQLTFYTNTPADVSWGDLYYVLTLSEGDITEFNTSTNFGEGQQCFSGRISVMGNEMTLVFSEPYVYEGGNLQFSYYTYKSGSVNNSRANWLGVYTQNTSGYGSSYYKYYYTNSGYSSSGMQSFLPKTTIYYSFPECIKPADFGVSDITTNSATLSWTPLAEGQDWEIQYRKADETDYAAVEGTITNPYTLQGLEPSHGYFVRMRAVCGNDSYSDWAEIRFNTDCAPITLPYTYGFEDIELYELPACWSLLASGSTYSATTWNSTWSNTGDRCLTLYCGDTEGSVIAIMPEIPVDAEHPMSGNELVFYAVSYFSPTTCQVGMMTDPTDLSSFELVEEVDVNEGLYASGSYHRFRVSFADYTGNGTYIAIRKVRDEGEDAERLLIDDVEVRPIPDCYEPTALTVTAITSSTATLQWTAGGEETSWQVQYKFPYDEWPETYQTVYQNPCTLEGLTPGMAYRVRVRAVCSATETSDWTDYAKFITPYSTPYYEDFEVYSSSNYSPDNLTRGWRFAYGVPMDDVLAGTTQLVPTNESSGWQFSSYHFTNPDNGMTYHNYELVECYVDMSDQYIWLVSPYIELGEGYQLNFDLGLVYTQTDPSGLDDNRFGVLITQDDGTTWSRLALWDNDATQGRAYYDLPEIPAEVNVAIPDTYNNKLVRIAFCAESVVYNSGNNRLHVDNVNVTKCIRPEMIVASNITANSASIDWTSHDETSWTLQYRIGETGEWTTVSSITAHPYYLTGLVSSNYYQVRVKAHNANGESGWSTIAQFATECVTISLGPDDIYEQTFEGNMDPACWIADPYIASSSSNGGWRLTYLYDEQGNLDHCAHAGCNWGTINANLYMPQIEVTPGLCITFHHNSNIKSTVRVMAYITLPWLENVVLWDSETDDLSAGVTTLSLNDYVGETVTFTFNFYATNSGEFYLFDVTLRNLNTFTKQTEDGYWDETANWSKSVLPQAGQSLLIDGEAIIPDGCTAQANEILMTSNGSLTLADGGQLEHNNAGVVATVQKSITPYTIAQTNGNQKANGWYLIASPMQNAVEPMESMISNAFDLYRFNQSNELEWENYLQYFYLSPYFKLFNGKGYLYANNGGGTNDAVTVDINGQLQPGNEELSFPLVYDASADFAGWNLVGNPYAHNVTAYTATSVENGCFRMNETHDDLMVSEVSATDPLQPMEGFFVKASGTDANISFNAQGRASKNEDGGSIFVEVMEGGKTTDRLIVKTTERKPLEKFSLNDGRTKVFAMRDHREMAIVPCEGNEQAVNFKAADNGTYTIAVRTENLNLAYLHLIDNLTGNDVDLLATPNYTFEAKTSDYASRFRLVFIPNETDGPSTGSGAFAFINNGNIIIIGAEAGAVLQIVDVTGRILVSRKGDAMNRISTNGLAKGVYVLRLIEGEKVKTQKIVID